MLKIEIMLKIYYDRFMETCHNIFQTLICFLPFFLFLFLVSIFSNIQKHSFFLEIVIRTPFAHLPLVVRSPSACPALVVRAPSALFACHPRVVRTIRAPFASCPRVLRIVCAPSASCLLVLRTPSVSCSRILCALFGSGPCTVSELTARPPCTVRELSAHRAPFALLMLLFSQNQIKMGSK